MTDDKNRFAILFIFPLVSTILLSVGFIFYGAVYDYVFYNFYEISVNLQNQSIMSNVYVNLVESTINSSSFIVSFLDYFWLASFIFLIGQMIYVSYYSRRQNTFSFLVWVNYGIMFFLFVSSIFKEISQWFYDIIFLGLLENMTVELNFFTYYLDNYGIINMIIIFICLFINFIDLDFIKFSTRKSKELPNDEL